MPKKKEEGVEEKVIPSPVIQPKEVVKFEKSTYPDLITGYPIEYYNMYKFMTDTLMWFDNTIMVNFSIYASRQKNLGNPENNYGFYNIYEAPDTKNYISMQRSFGCVISIEMSKACANRINVYDTSIFRHNFHADHLAEFKYTQKNKMLSWYYNPGMYLESILNKKGEPTGKYNAARLKSGINSGRDLVAELKDKNGNRVYFVARPDEEGCEDGQCNGLIVTMNLNKDADISDRYIPWSKIFEFFEVVIDLNMAQYGSSMLSFLGMAPIGVGMSLDYMQKFDRLNHKQKKMSLKSKGYFSDHADKRVEKTNIATLNQIMNNKEGS